MNLNGVSNYSYTPSFNGSSPLNGTKQEEDAAKKGINSNGKSPDGECETCKDRKYQDGSNENVSFKSPAHISPSASASAVMSHEAEHVSNAYSKAAEKNGKVVSAGVSLQTSSCPECGSSYVSGGETRTTIKYSNESNPYQQNQKALDALKLSGANVNLVA